MLHIQIATVSDIAAIQYIANTTWEITYKKILSKEQMSYMLNWMYNSETLTEQITSKHTTFFVAKNKNISPEIIGFAALSEEDNLTIKLQKLYILPNMQNIGLGKALLQTIIDFSNNKGASKIQLQVNRNNAATDFYKKFGFAIIAEADFEIGNGYFMNDYVMELPLL